LARVADEFRVLLQRPEAQVLAWRDVVVQRFTDNGGVETISAVMRAQRSHVAGLGRGKSFSISHVKIPKLSPPAPDVRELIKEQNAFINENMWGSIIVLDVSGFAAAMVRGIASATALLLPRTKLVTATVRTMREALEFYLVHRAGPRDGVELDWLLARYDERQVSIDERAA